eukprot:399650-Amorphochlora_amoeboformis.AAC.2
MEIENERVRKESEKSETYESILDLTEHVKSVWVIQITGSGQVLQVLEQLTASDKAADATPDDINLLLNATRVG